ncbi:unnamed protein product [Fraxinus pennsylvanica]|uniref:Uncharacterized protein n=1 Tax=Fraxinus pennsylvanica TaxID=56036 RepID=A0AAD2E588_9LAMI|nr:unnamed protein product [Fraxinus pennsylvanica]
MSSSFPVLPTPLGERYPKLAVSKQDSRERERVQHSPAIISQMSSNNGVVGHLFSSSSGYSTDLFFSSNPEQKNHPRQSHLISQSTNSETSLMLPHSVDSEAPRSTASSHYNKEDYNPSWCTDSLPDFLDYPLSTSIQNNQLERSNCSGTAIPSEELTKHDDWQEWANQLLTDDDALTSDWNELLADASIADPAPKVHHHMSNLSTNFSIQQPNEQLPATPGETCTTVAQSSSANCAQTKQRMRWTPELHEAFVEAVNKLGGSESNSSFTT